MEQINLHKIDWLKVILVSVIIFLLSMLYVTWQNGKTANANVDALTADAKSYRLKNGNLAMSVGILQYDKQQLKKEIAKNKTAKEVASKFAKVTSLTKEIVVTKIDTITIVYRDSIPCKFERDGAIFTPEYSLGYKSNQFGIKITELSIPDSIIMVAGTKRKWFLGKETKTFDLTHTNKFVQTEEVQHIELLENKKWYRTDVAKIGGGIILFEIAKALLSK